MAENDQNLWWNVNVTDLSSLSVDDTSLEDVNIDDVAAAMAGDGQLWWVIDVNQDISWQRQINANVFLETWDGSNAKAQNLNKDSELGKYVRLIFVSWTIIILWILFLVLAFSFDLYIKQASKPTVDTNYQSYVTRYRTYLWKIKDLAWYNNISNYQRPNAWWEMARNTVNLIINATDIDYIDKKELLSDYVSSLSRDIRNDSDYMWTLKEKIAKEWFLPHELETLLSEDQGIDTIQRSLTALEIIKFSTATKVFSYMNTALITISEMVKIRGASVENIKKLFEQLNEKWENDIAAYVYMCYLNPYETNANCDRIWDLDLYYHNINDNSIFLPLFKNTMSAISQLLEKEDTTLFSITFNGFDAQAKNLSFNVEVYTNQEDELALKAQWKRNPNIFILSNVINLLKLSKFIIWAEINASTMHVEPRTLEIWGITRNVNYSNKEFTVPIQKNTEREIFDYIDLDVIRKLIIDKGLQGTWNNATETEENDETETEESDEFEAEESDEFESEESDTIETEESDETETEENDEFETEESDN